MVIYLSNESDMRQKAYEKWDEARKNSSVDQKTVDALKADVDAWDAKVSSATGSSQASGMFGF